MIHDDPGIALESRGSREPVDHSLQPSPWMAATLGELVFASAARHPQRTALWVDGNAISYQALAGQAGAVARALIDSGRATGSKQCAVLGRRSLTTFAGFVGAAFARCAYVPLNPRYPQARLAAILEAAEATAIVVDGRSFDQALELLRITERPLLVLMPDAKAVPDWACELQHHRFLCGRDLDQQVSPGIAPGATGQDGAYLLFTSGSTGVPKGVLVRNRNAMAYLRSVAQRYAPTSDDRFSQLFDPTFDLSVHEMFLCWGAGAALYCPPHPARMIPRDFVHRHDLTFWFSVPSTVAVLLHNNLLHPGDLPGLRWSLFCGEAFPKRLAVAWAAAAPNSIVENLYGPTETTIALTAYRLPSDPIALDAVPDIVPIGAPLPGQATLILGAYGQLAPSGEPGELLLGGSQVTDGYWQRPDLTAQQFIQLPGHGEQPWYRTGDRAKATTDHGLVFLGRLDRQVKIAGFRVELQEVESTLRLAANSASTAAIASPVDADGLARGIVAFVMGSDRTKDAILGECRRLLPPHVVPSRVIILSEWPTNSNGKTDYGALRQMIDRPDVETGATAHP